jgi:hypothetical protein
MFASFPEDRSLLPELELCSHPAINMSRHGAHGLRQQPADRGAKTFLR